MVIILLIEVILCIFREYSYENILELVLKV